MPEGTLNFFKDAAQLVNAPLAPATAIAVNPAWNATQRALAATYNRLGGLMRPAAQQAGGDVASVLALWIVESSGRVHTVGRAVIRFENHLLYSEWGQRNAAQYRAHFRHGGFEGTPGKAWENHQFRADAAAAFQPVHANQTSEYATLNTAIGLAGDAPALESASIGGCQIVMDNWKMIGYASAREMYDAFQASERAHVLGFFDFCQAKLAPKAGDLLRYMRAHDWRNFTLYYNGSGQVDKYSTGIQSNYAAAQALLAGR